MGVEEQQKLAALNERQIALQNSQERVGIGLPMTGNMSYSQPWPRMATLLLTEREIA